MLFRQISPAPRATPRLTHSIASRPVGRGLAPVWVKTADLYAAMNTVDASADGRRRGYVLVRAAR
jgi:hypothetical protein